MKKKFNVKKFYMTMIIIGLLIYAILTIIAQQTKLNSYSTSQKYYSEKIEEAKLEQEKLNEQKNSVDSEEYIESVAREKLDMFLPNERVYIDIGQ